MPPVHHRSPGPIPALLGAGGVYLEIIGDSVHVDLQLLRELFRAPALAGRLMLVSDGTDVSGLPDGQYRRWEGTPVEVLDGRAYTRGGGVAGSTGTLSDAIRNLTGVGVPLELALAAASQNPARSLGLTDRGEIREGLRADRAVLTPELGVEATFVAGRRVHSTENKKQRMN